MLGTTATTPSAVLDEVLRAGAVRTVFQPIVDLDSGAVVAYEALSRGPAGVLERPDALFGAARESGRLRELDELCRRRAVESAAALVSTGPMTLFVNVEPEALRVEALDELVQQVAAVNSGLGIVLEITERAIAARPAELLATVRRLRAAGWRIALDDVGADDLSLAFMPLLRPDIVKLDLSLVQERPGPAIAHIMNAVNAYAESTGAVLLAEGIETSAHVGTARALGARLGQGWLFGRPAARTSEDRQAAPLRMPPPSPLADLESPYLGLPATAPVRRSTKPLLIEISKHLEREALRLGSACLVLSTFQHARHFTPRTARRYADIVAAVGFAAALARDLPPEPLWNLRGADLNPADPVVDEWDLVVLAPHFSAALLARDTGLHDSTADAPSDDSTRLFDFALTYDRDMVVAAAQSLMSRILPDPGGSAQ